MIHIPICVIAVSYLSCDSWVKKGVTNVHGGVRSVYPIQILYSTPDTLGNTYLGR